MNYVKMEQALPLFYDGDTFLLDHGFIGLEAGEFFIESSKVSLPSSLPDFLPGNRVL